MENDFQPNDFVYEICSCIPNTDGDVSKIIIIH